MTTIYNQRLKIVFTSSLSKGVDRELYPSFSMVCNYPDMA